VMTTPGGLYRYDLGDRLVCRGHVNGVPRLEFMGRAVATDIVGEKLSEDFVADALGRVGAGACLAARTTEAPFYELLIDAGPDEDLAPHAAQVEECLRANPQYAYARALGQLGPVKPRAVARLIDRYTRVQARRGCRLADIKPPVLINETAYAALMGANPGACPQ
jgi:GH3 auxin-responsive promoter